MARRRFEAGVVVKMQEVWGRRVLEDWRSGRYSRAMMTAAEFGYCSQRYDETVSRDEVWLFAMSADVL